MQVSAELRWFWKEKPLRVEEWFRGPHHAFPAGGGGTRADDYLEDPGQPELSIKRRGGKHDAEIKGMVAVLAEPAAAFPFTGAIEVWTKWTSASLTFDPKHSIRVQKQRWLRKFDTHDAVAREIEVNPDEQSANQETIADGCNFEFTILDLPGGDAWWTLGFEAFGALDTVERNLRRAIQALVDRHPPDLAPGIFCGYPEWLSKYCRPSR